MTKRHVQILKYTHCIVIDILLEPYDDCGIISSNLTVEKPQGSAAIRYELLIERQAS
jgi:hypothetical protein